MVRKIGSITLMVGLLFSVVSMAQTPASAPAGSTGLCRDGSYWSGPTKREPATVTRGYRIGMRHRRLPLPAPPQRVFLQPRPPLLPPPSLPNRRPRRLRPWPPPRRPSRMQHRLRSQLPAGAPVRCGSTPAPRSITAHLTVGTARPRAASI